MFEFEQYDKNKHKRIVNGKGNTAVQESSDNYEISSFSILNWGEHCTECAFPECFRSCDLYEARADGRCRRFEYGIYKNENIRTKLNYSAEVKFKPSSQLWTQGNATQFSRFTTNALLSIHNLIFALASILDTFIYRLFGRTILSLILQAIRRRIILSFGKLYRWCPKPDSFHMEFYNPSNISYRIMLTMKNRGSNNIFQWADSLDPGYGHYDIKTDEIESHVDLSRPFGIIISLDNPDDKVLCICFAAFAKFKSQEWKVTKALAAKQNSKKRIKCLVWDLDNTLWDGILLESMDGKMGLRNNVRATLEELDKRGILLSIASKNNEDGAKKILKALGIWDYFLVPQINWSAKSSSIQIIAEQLNIGIDSLAFIDDSPFELEQVESVHPDVLCLHAHDYMNILNHPAFTGDTSTDGSKRRYYYKAEFSRKNDIKKLAMEIDDFLATCDICVDILVPSKEHIPRIYDIVQRTNQLNFSGIRYSHTEIEEIINDPLIGTYVIGCKDKYGDYGLVGFCIIDETKKPVVLRDLMLSCRVQGKKVEHSILIYLSNYYFGQGHGSFQAIYRRTKRNAPSGKVFDDLKFRRIAKVNEGDLLQLDLKTKLAPIPYIKINAVREQVNKSVS